VSATIEASDRLKHFIESQPLTHFKLNGPHNLTTKSRAGAYRKHDVNGGEEFAPVSCYLGKRGDIIVCFKPRSAMPWATMEMTLDEAIESLDKFLIYVDSSETSFGKAVAEAATAATINRMEDPAFASW